MLRIFAILIGIAFIGMGVAGFLPQYRLNDLLFGQFEVDNLYSVFHIACGILAIISAMSTALTRIFFQLIGLLFAVVAIFGFLRNGDLIIIHVNNFAYWYRHYRADVRVCFQSMIVIQLLNNHSLFC